MAELREDRIKCPRCRIARWEWYELDDTTGEIVRKKVDPYEAEFDRCPGCEKIDMRNRNRQASTNTDGLFAVLTAVDELDPRIHR